MYKTLVICLQRFTISFITEISFSDNVSSYSRDSLDSIGMNWMDTASLIAAFNSEASSYDTENKIGNDAAPIKPYQFEPSTEL